jgi:hypothetical protein
VGDLVADESSLSAQVAELSAEAAENSTAAKKLEAANKKLQNDVTLLHGKVGWCGGVCGRVAPRQGRVVWVCVVGGLLHGKVGWCVGVCGGVVYTSPLPSTNNEVYQEHISL